ncbi:MAG: DUF1616 domain-containing protein [Firmicutes bacterium]|nr:DUF1616 domain-containing protein [Bacillota bacterium]
MYASSRLPPSRIAQKKAPRLVHFLDLGLLFCAAAGLLALSSLGGTETFPRAVLALLVGGLGPGYSLTAALWNNDALSMEERLVLSLVFSISVVVLLALVMSRLDIRITGQRLSLGLAAVIFAAVSWAAYRRLFGRSESSPAYRIKPVHYAALASALVLAVGTALAIRPALTARSPAFYVTTLQNRQTGLPGYVEEDSRVVVRLTVNQGTARPTTYRLFAQAGARLFVDRTIRVKHRWSAAIALPTHAVGVQRVIFWLTPRHSDRRYRALWLSYHVEPPASNP